MVNLDEVLTFSEAAEKWGLADGKTIRKAVERGRFEPHEIKKSGNVWLTTYDAMCRVFKEPRQTSVSLFYFDLYDEERYQGLLDQFFKAAEEAIACGEMVSIVESRQHPERIICILKSEEELTGCRRRMQHFMRKNDN